MAWFNAVLIFLSILWIQSFTQWIWAMTFTLTADAVKEPHITNICVSLSEIVRALKQISSFRFPFQHTFDWWQSAKQHHKPIF